MVKGSIFSIGIALLLCGCAVKNPITHQYQLEAFSHQVDTNKHRSISILVSTPEAVSGYQTEAMHYVITPYSLDAFVHHAWVAPPASMLSPLLLQSLQQSGYFYAVVSTPFASKADYRLDTQIIQLQQNFLTKPSTETLIVKVVLTRISDETIIASKIMKECVPCTHDTPYGGVLAANQATKHFTERLVNFVISHIRKDKA